MKFEKIYNSVLSEIQTLFDSSINTITITSDLGKNVIDDMITKAIEESNISNLDNEDNKIINTFKAIYNPFIRKMAVLFGDTISNYTFTEEEEWTKVSYNGDQDHPNYLHVQLDYDECCQLLFYPRRDGDHELHEDLGSYFNSDDMSDIPENIVIVYNDVEFEREYSKLLEITKKEVEIPYGL